MVDNIKPLALFFIFFVPIIFAQTNVEMRYFQKPGQVFIDGKLLKSTDKLKPGKYSFVVKFARYKTIKKTVEIKPNSKPPYFLDVNLVALKKFELKIARKYYNLKIDDIKYPIRIYVDGQQLEDHHINLEDVGPVVYYNFYAPMEMRSMTISIGFYKDTSLIKRRFEFRDLSEIDITLLLKHLQNLVKSGKTKLVLGRIQTILSDKIDGKKLKRTSKKSRKMIADFVGKLVLSNKERMLQNKLIIDLE